MSAAGRGRRLRLVAWAVVLAVQVALLGRALFAPLDAWSDFNSAMYSQFARNHLQYGITYTKLYCTWGDTAAPPRVPQRYLNHPPLLPLALAASIGLFGDHEWAVRLVPIAATLGSTLLLMAIAWRRRGLRTGFLVGFAYAVLPASAGFGRMVDHVAPVQFFSLLMLYGYLSWTEAAPTPGRRRGPAFYVLGATLGVGVGWAAVLMAGLIAAWHGLQVVRRRAASRDMLWLAGVPAAAFLAVAAHIAAGTGGDLEMLRGLLLDRTLAGEGGRTSWASWCDRQWGFLLRNFTPVGLLAALAGLAGAGAPSGLDTTDGTQCGRGGLALPTAVLGLQGLLYVVIFKNQSWFHQYWQFFLAPAVALLAGSGALLVARAARRLAPALALPAALGLLAAIVPWTMTSLRSLEAQQIIAPETIEALSELGKVLPYRAPACSSYPPNVQAESFGRYRNEWPHPVMAYYANRPMRFSRDAQALAAGLLGCDVYLLRRSRRPWSLELEAALRKTHPVRAVADHHLIFDLSAARP